LNWFNSNPGVDIIITNFGDFSHFLSKWLAILKLLFAKIAVCMYVC
jgi:hypothetical protein